MYYYLLFIRPKGDLIVEVSLYRVTSSLDYPVTYGHSTVVN